MDRFELAVQTTLFCGVLALGVALGAAIGLNELQTSCVAAGKLPTPGSVLLGGQINDNACWEGAERMQAIANTAGAIAGAMLLGGAIADTYEERVKEVLT